MAERSLRRLVDAVDQFHVWPEGIIGDEELDEATREARRTLDRVDRRRESWRRASRKYRAKKAVKQEAMFDE